VLYLQLYIISNRRNFKTVDLYMRKNIHYFGLIEKIILITTWNNLLLQIYPLGNNRMDEILLNFNVQKLLCGNIEFETIDFDYHLHINVDDMNIEIIMLINLKQNLFLFGTQH
jgi:hypothetical protein